MPLLCLSIAILCTVGYHLVLKLTPAGVNPLLSLLVTYALVTLLFGLVLLVAPGGFEWRQELRHLNWTALALAAVIVGLDLGFLYPGAAGSPGEMASFVKKPEDKARANPQDASIEEAREEVLGTDPDIGTVPEPSAEDRDYKREADPLDQTPKDGPMGPDIDG